MKILYFDCFAGISGDMTIGALLDLGVDARWLEAELQKLNLRGYRLEVGPSEKRGITGTRFKVVLTDAEGTETDDPGLAGLQNGDTGHSHPHAHGHDHSHSHAHGHSHDHHGHDHSHKHPHHHNHHGHDDHPHHHPHQEEASHPHEHTHGHDHSHGDYEGIRRLILESTLDEAVKSLALKIFHRIARAEAKVHGKSLETVHFHEVGAVDSIVDIVGAALCITVLNPDRIYCSPVHAGSGFIQCAHGFMPVPAPATLEIFSESSLRPYATHLKGEFTTPTGAAILAETAIPLEGFPTAKVLKVGYGAGTKDFEIPNMVRAILAEHPETPAEPVWVLEANMDDISGEALGYTTERLLAAGALDAYCTAVQMKKNRPGVLLTVLCDLEHRSALETLILRETTTLGLRLYPADRITMHRHSETVETPYGPVSVKFAHWNGITKAAPEYEDCRRLAEAQGVPLREVMNAALKGAQ